MDPVLSLPRYWANRAPSGLESLSGQSELDAGSVARLEQSWQKACERAAADPTPDAEYAAYWTGWWLADSYLHRVEGKRRLEVLRATLEAVRDAGYQDMLRCELTRASIDAGDLAAAEGWLDGCETQSGVAVIDAYRNASLAALRVAERRFREALEIVGNSEVTGAPLSRLLGAEAQPGHPALVLAGRVRVEALLGLGRRAQARRQLLASLSLHGDRFSQSMSEIEEGRAMLQPQRGPRGGPGAALAVGLAVALGGGAIAVWSVANSVPTHVSGRLQAAGSAGSWTMAPDVCESGQRRSFFGVRLFSEGDKRLGISVIEDPLQGTALKVNVPGRQQAAVLRRSDCRVLEATLERQGSTVNRIANLKGSLRVDCTTDALGLGHLEGEVTFENCH